ncbi:MAG: CDP-alcohol phosphatidyltransferase family protein [Chloroflexota bacterium]
MNKEKSGLWKLLTNPFEAEAVINIRTVLYRKPVQVLSDLGVTPNIINTLGLITGLIAAVLVGLSNIRLGVLFYFLSGLCDSLDGPIARHRNLTSDFGAFFDSVSDRYVDVAMLIGVAWYYQTQGELLLGLLAMISILGGSLVSYTKARAESLGVESRSVGIMTRMARGLSLLIGLIYLPILPIVLWIQAIFTNVTALRRFLFYRQILLSRIKQ